VRAAGWQVVQVEFRHHYFSVGATGEPQRSRLYCSVHLTRSEPEARAALAGELGIEWAAESAAGDLPVIRRIDASRLTLQTRTGGLPFALVFEETVVPPDKSYFIDPLILHDLDGDGRSEIILAARNLVYRLRPWNRLESEALCRHSPGLIFTGW